MNKAKQEALEKVYLKIAETGQPTDAQLRFIRACEAEENAPTIENIMKALNSPVVSMLTGGTPK